LVLPLIALKGLVPLQVTAGILGITIMWLKKFFSIISDAPNTKPAPNLLENLAKLDPDRFYVENVRSILGVSYDEAVAVCKSAVEKGIFRECVEVLCPDGSVAEKADKIENLPDTVFCIDDVNGDYERREYSTVELRKQPFFRYQEV
jgi:hypothetical protein